MLICHSLLIYIINIKVKKLVIFFTNNVAVNYDENKIINNNNNNNPVLPLLPGKQKQQYIHKRFPTQTVETASYS